MTPEERRALLGEAAVKRARELAAQAPRLDPSSPIYAALAVLLTRRKPKKNKPDAAA